MQDAKIQVDPDDLEGWARRLQAIGEMLENQQGPQDDGADMMFVASAIMMEKAETLRKFLVMQRPQKTWNN